MLEVQNSKTSRNKRFTKPKLKLSRSSFNEKWVRHIFLTLFKEAKRMPRHAFTFFGKKII